MARFGLQILGLLALTECLAPINSVSIVGLFHFYFFLCYVWLSAFFDVRLGALLQRNIDLGFVTIFCLFHFVGPNIY